MTAATDTVVGCSTFFTVQCSLLQQSLSFPELPHALSTSHTHTQRTKKLGFNSIHRQRLGQSAWVRVSRSEGQQTPASVTGQTEDHNVAKRDGGLRVDPHRT